ncbi:hypothetical protein BD410DRAFT_842607 [Rickenella mellea]|uniref:Transmembrane protein n=1 Tax=Rickenella mellea TaxID=50990 RepID=A0A4Y7PVX1_9AGAM|nr:hypothetical protein BD410DRAFT_842607 [Rickenella mellea]
MITPDTSDDQKSPPRETTVPDPSLAVTPEPLEEQNSSANSPVRTMETGRPPYATVGSSEINALPTLPLTKSPDATVANPAMAEQRGVASSKNSVTSGTGIPNLVKAQDPKTTDPEKQDNAPENLSPKGGAWNWIKSFWADEVKFSHVKMGGFVVIGTCVALAHHFFCNFLSGRPSTSVEFSFLKFTLDLPWALTIGNGLAWLVQFLFTLSIGEVIAQRFWHLLHSKPIDLEKMDDVYQIQTTFWKPSLWHYATTLSVLAAILLAMSATLSTFTSPALSVGPVLLYGPCSLSTVDLGSSELLVAGGSATPALVQLAIRTLESGSYLPPLPSPCGNCTYNVMYTAPALQCSHIDIASSPFLNDSATDIVLWNTTLGQDPNGFGYELFVWLRQGNLATLGNNAEPEIVSCKALNATYYASVGYITGAMVNTTVQIIPYVNNPSGDFTIQQTAFDAMMLALYATVRGTLDLVVTGKSGSASESSLIAYSPVGNFTTASWTINGDLLTVLPSLMQNISIGLLAKSVAADTTSSTLSSVPDGHCSVETFVYQYDRVRLLGVYGIGILVTAICAVVGIYSLRTGKGGSMSFKNMMLAILSPQMTGKEGADVLPSLIRAVNGRFVPAEHPAPVLG